METRSHRVSAQVARRCDVGVTETRCFAHQKHLAIERRKTFERFAQSRRKLLSRCRNGLVELDGHAAPAIVANVVVREIPRDAEHPRAPPRLVRDGDRPAGDTKEHLLRQLAGLPVSDEPAQIPEDPIPVRTEQNVCVAHERLLS